MNRNVVSGIAAFALLVGAALAMNESSAYAGNCGGGLFSKLHAKQACGGGGLLSKLKSRGSSDCCAPEPVCCEPEPVCCEPAPTCCEPEPACCGSSRPKLFSRLCAKLKARRSCCAPEPTCCEPAPCCEAAPACGGCEAAPACGGCEAAPACGGCEAAPACGGCAAAAPAPCAACGGAAGADAGYNLAPGETLVPGSVQNVEAAAETSASDAPPAPAPDADTNI